MRQKTSNALLSGNENAPHAALAPEHLQSAYAAREIDGAEFSRLMATLGCADIGSRLAVAVSGGPDSLALTYLAADWARETGRQLTALTVDHGLRPESRAEAQRVAKILADAGIQHEILTWHGNKPRTGIQAAARDARYDLMVGWAQQNETSDILLGHHVQDQAETFLLRIAGGSGSDGLAGMNAITTRQGVRILRPLLTVPRERLRATLEKVGITPIEDPSNVDRRYARVRMRELLPQLANKGFTPARLAALINQFGRLRSELDQLTQISLSRCCTFYPEGYAELDTEPFKRLPSLLAERVVGTLTTAIGANPYLPKRPKLLRLAGRISGTADFRGATLGNCRFLPWRGKILVCREPRFAGERLTVDPGVRETWFGGYRWHFEQRSQFEDGLAVGFLTKTGWRQLCEQAPAVKKSLIPGVVRPTLPALYRGPQVVAVPHLGYDIGATRVICEWRPSSRIRQFTPGCLASREKDTICTV